MSDNSSHDVATDMYLPPVLSLLLLRYDIHVLIVDEQ